MTVRIHQFRPGSLWVGDSVQLLLGWRMELWSFHRGLRGHCLGPSTDLEIARVIGISSKDAFIHESLHTVEIWLACDYTWMPWKLKLSFLEGQGSCLTLWGDGGRCRLLPFGMVLRHLQATLQNWYWGLVRTYSHGAQWSWAFLPSRVVLRLFSWDVNARASKLL